LINSLLSYWKDWLVMDFPQKLASLRKKKGFSQKELADLIGLHVIQISRYETGSSQPTLDVIRKLSRSLNCTADELIFDINDRGPDSDLRLQFEAISSFSSEDKLIVKAVLEALILRHEARRWSSSVPIAQKSTKPAKPAKLAKSAKRSKSA
jgi:transcriptional regulator with XRE-family HTH domain